MLEWVLRIAFFAAVFYFAWRKNDKHFAEDLILTLKKAHMGQLPKGQYAEQIISAKTFSRDELRVPLDVETLRRMEECVKVHRHDVQLRTISSKVNWHSQDCARRHVSSATAAGGSWREMNPLWSAPFRGAIKINRTHH